jgi:hypothetical protein
MHETRTTYIAKVSLSKTLHFHIPLSPVSTYTIDLPHNRPIPLNPIHRRPQRIHQTHHGRAKRRMQPQPQIIIRLTPINHQLIRKLAENLDRTGIHRASGCPMFLPLINSTAIPIGVDLRTIRVGHNNSAVGTAERTPHDVRTGIGCGGVVDDNGAANRVSEFERRVGHYVVHGVVYAVRGGVANGEFVDENPLLKRRNEGDDCHARARNVLVVGDVVDDGTPGFEVRRSLMRELLAVLGVALVGIVGD